MAGMTKRVIFCANQVSLCIGVSLAVRDHGAARTTIFFSPERCDPIPFQNCDVALIPYSRRSFIGFVARNFFKRPDEVCVPHLKSGRLINAYVKYAKVVSAIDDGMDTFRETPRNIDPGYFSVGANYYTFTYAIPLAGWLRRFSIVGVCSVCELARSSRPALKVDGLRFLVVESPGIGAVRGQLASKGNGVLIKHSNPNKSQNCFPDLPCVNGSSIAMEETISDFDGTLFVGESMVLVYALFCRNTNLRIVATLPEGALMNLKALNVLLHDNDNNVSLLIAG